MPGCDGAGRNGGEELPHVQGQGRRPRVPGCDSTGAAERSYPRSKVRGCGWEELPLPEARGGGWEELPLARGQGRWLRGVTPVMEQWLHRRGRA